MIITSIVHWCPACTSTDIVKNGHTQYGSQRSLCHDCGKTRVLFLKRDETVRAFIEKAPRERLSLRGIARIFGIAVQTVLLVLKGLAQALPALKASLMPARADDVLELDELYNFVGKKAEKRWLWVALCRRTRQVVAYVIGDRSEQTCRRLFRRIPENYPDAFEGGIHKLNPIEGVFCFAAGRPPSDGPPGQILHGASNLRDQGGTRRAGVNPPRRNATSPEPEGYPQPDC